ncbi:MAG: HEAT repeat domain-containing protein [Pirellulales bacterium]
MNISMFSCSPWAKPLSRSAGLAVLLLATWLVPAIATAQSDEPSLIRVLQSESPKADKALACKGLAVHGTAQAIPALAPLLADQELASWARIALEAIPDPAADAALRDAVGKLDGNLLIGVINSIGVRRDSQAVTLLAERLNADNTDVAVAAALSMGRIGDGAAADALLSQLNNDNAAVRSAAAEGCVRCAEHRLAAGETPLATRLYDAARGADVPRARKIEATRGAIVVRGVEGIPLLEEQLLSNDRHFFSLGLSTARELPGEQVTAAVAKLIEKLPANRQALVLLVLADRHDAAALPTVLEVARKGPTEARLAALEALGQLGAASSLPVLLEVAQEGESEVAQVALETLAGLSGAEIDQQLIDRLGQSSGAARRQLIEVIGRRRIAAAAPALIAALKDSDASTRQQAAVSLGETVSQQDLGVLVDYLVSVSGSADQLPPVLQALKNACVRMPNRDACAELLAKAMAKAPAGGKSALLETMAAVGGTKALQSVGETARSGDAELQDLATRLLGNWMTADAAPVLQKLAEQPQHKYQLRSLRGLIRIARQFVLEDAQRAELCQAALKAAKRNDEKLMVLEIVERYPSLPMLGVATQAAQDPALKEAAVKSALTVAQHLGDSDEVRTQLEKLGLKPVKVEIVKAEYGAQGQFKDVSDILRRHAGVTPLIRLPSGYNDTFGGDPAPGIPKQLKVTFRLDGKQAEATFLENDLILLSGK